MLLKCINRRVHLFLQIQVLHELDIWIQSCIELVCVFHYTNLKSLRSLNVFNPKCEIPLLFQQFKWVNLLNHVTECYYWSLTNLLYQIDLIECDFRNFLNKLSNGVLIMNLLTILEVSLILEFIYLVLWVMDKWVLMRTLN